MLANGTPVPVTVQGAGMVDAVRGRRRRARGRAGHDRLRPGRRRRLAGLADRPAPQPLDPPLAIDLRRLPRRWGAPEAELRGGARARLPARRRVGRGRADGVGRRAARGRRRRDRSSPSRRTPARCGSRGPCPSGATSPSACSDARSSSPSDEFSGSDAAPAVLSFRAGGVEAGDEGQDRRARAAARGRALTRARASRSAC